MISIVIPVHKTEEAGYITRTLDGIIKTIGIPANKYTITLVGTLPAGVFSSKTKAKYNFLPTDALLGDAKNRGAKYAMAQYNPDVLVFMDAHMNFFDIESKNWGIIICDFFKVHPNTACSPAISAYDNPTQRGFGFISEIIQKEGGYDTYGHWSGDAKNSNQPFVIPGLCGCFMAMPPHVFAASIIGFTPPLAIEDCEFSLRIWELGIDMYSIPSITIGHRFQPSYNGFTKERSIDWGTGRLLYTFLNMDEKYTIGMYNIGISASQDKVESLRRATTPYWRQVQQEIMSKKVRTPEQYFRRFS